MLPKVLTQKHTDHLHSSSLSMSCTFCGLHFFFFFFFKSHIFYFLLRKGLRMNKTCLPLTINSDNVPHRSNYAWSRKTKTLITAALRVKNKRYYKLYIITSQREMSLDPCATFLFLIQMISDVDQEYPP